MKPLIVGVGSLMTISLVPLQEVTQIIIAVATVAYQVYSFVKKWRNDKKTK